MTFPIFVHQNNGHFEATLAGKPDLCVSAPTREQALAEMQRQLEQRYASGELVFLNVPAEGILAAAGKYRDDPFLAEIREEIYRQRDAEPKE